MSGCLFYYYFLYVSYHWNCHSHQVGVFIFYIYLFFSIFSYWVKGITLFTYLEHWHPERYTGNDVQTHKDGCSPKKMIDFRLFRGL